MIPKVSSLQRELNPQALRKWHRGAVVGGQASRADLRNSSDRVFLGKIVKFQLNAVSVKSLIDGRESGQRWCVGRFLLDARYSKVVSC